MSHYVLRHMHFRYGLNVAALVGLLSGLTWGETVTTRGAETTSQPAASISREAVAQRLGPQAPEVDRLDRIDLTRFTRRLLSRQMRKEALDDMPVYTPSTLGEVNCRAAVTLRQGGRLLGTAHSERRPVMEAVREAALAALDNATGKVPLEESDLDGLGLELELIGETQRVGHGGEAAERLAQHFEPGIHGVEVRVADREVLVRPSQLISMEMFCNDHGTLGHRCDRYKMTIESLQEKLGLLREPTARPPESVSVGRFQTTHWYQASADAEPVLLIAGMRLIDPAEVTLEAMEAAVKDLARYLRHRQTADGLFSYEFLPGRNTYWLRDQNWVRQAGTAWVVSRYARLSGDPGMAEASERAIAALGAMLRPTANRPRGAYLHTPDNLHALGTAALYALTLIDSPAAGQHEDTLARLMIGMEGMQQEDGSFRGHFPPSQKVASQDYYPCEALLAIARYYALHPDGERRALCDRALPYYVQYFRESRSMAFVPWHAQAWGEMARTTRLQKYADFVFEMTDWLIGMQLNETELPLAIYDGAIDTANEGRGGVNTAVYLEGIVDAIRTADAFGDVERAARYRDATRRAARFVIQLRFREEECYYVQSPGEVVGGMRNTPINPTLRIDHAQHALAGLMGAAEVLRPGGKQ